MTPKQQLAEYVASMPAGNYLSGQRQSIQTAGWGAAAQAVLDSEPTETVQVCGPPDDDFRWDLISAVYPPTPVSLPDYVNVVELTVPATVAAMLRWYQDGEYSYFVIDD